MSKPPSTPSKRSSARSIQKNLIWKQKGLQNQKQVLRRFDAFLLSFWRLRSCRVDDKGVAEEVVLEAENVYGDLKEGKLGDYEVRGYLSRRRGMMTSAVN